MKPSELRSIQQKLLQWFDENQRPLPWREHYDPYHVWISEIMLQQTQVKTMLSYFARWMKELPDIQSVAGAPEDKILKLWEGLGYYSRARNIQKTARLIVDHYAGEFPSDHDEILKLPGIGKYTAAAISSIAFNQDHAVVDGNVIRVLSRIFGYTKNTRLPAAEKQIKTWAQNLLPSGKARFFNQAMMEFGALQCAPASPNCGRCPLQPHCQAYNTAMVSQIPDRGPKKISKNIRVVVVVIKKGDRIFIQKRPLGGLMAGLWEFPGGKIEVGESDLAALHREILEEIGIRIKNPTFIKNIKHAYTSFKVDLHCYSAEFDSGRVCLKAASEGKWVKVSELKNYPFPAANVRLIDEIIRIPK